MLLVFTHPGGVKLSAGWALVVLAAGEASVVIPITAHLSLLCPGECMTPVTVWSLDGVARATLCVGLKPCMLYVALLR